jgi:GTPase
MEDSGEDEENLTEDVFLSKLTELKQICSHIGCKASVVYCNLLDDNQDAKKKYAKGAVLLRESPESLQNLLLEIRVAVTGNVDAGKSTTLGVLTKGVTDDGRGKARLNLFKHKHEIETGRTSSIGMEIMGFDAESNIIAYNNDTLKRSIDDVLESLKSKAVEIPKGDEKPVERHTSKRAMWDVISLQSAKVIG